MYTQAFKSMEDRAPKASTVHGEHYLSHSVYTHHRKDRINHRVGPSIYIVGVPGYLMPYRLEFMSLHSEPAQALLSVRCGMPMRNTAILL